MKTGPIVLKKLSNVVDKKVVKKTVYHKLNAKVNNLEKKIPHVNTLIHINRYNTDKTKL